jgi:hypothetical protein
LSLDLNLGLGIGVWICVYEFGFGYGFGSDIATRHALDLNHFRFIALNIGFGYELTLSLSNRRISKAWIHEP